MARAVATIVGRRNGRRVFGAALAIGRWYGAAVTGEPGVRKVGGA
jgi:hypothetical protein